MAPPNSVAANHPNMTARPSGQVLFGAIMFGLLLSIPLITRVISAAIFLWSFHNIHYNHYSDKPLHLYGVQSLFCWGVV